MLPKNRLLRYLLIATLLFAFVGYFAFTTFLFNPFEGRLGADVSALVPRDVDLFLAKADLRRDFDPFPELAAREEIEQLPAWQTFAASPEYAELRESMGLDAALAELKATLDQLPLRVDLLRVFGGRDVAVAGYFRSGGMAATDWAVYGRVNWMGKLAHSMLSYPGLIGLEKQGISATRENEVVTLSGGTLQKPLHLTRVRDVLVIGNQGEMVAKSRSLHAQGGADSFFNSARYNDHVRSATRSQERDELELFADLRSMFETQRIGGPLPDPGSHDVGTALLGRLFQVPALKELIGVVQFDGGLALDVHGEFSQERVSSVQERFYRLRGIDREDILDAASLAPADCALFLYAQVPIGEFLKQMLESADPALRTNLEDLVRSSKSYSGVEELINVLDRALENKFALILRELDYELEMAKDEQTGEMVYVGPPNDGQPVFATSVVTWAKDVAAVEQVRSVAATMAPNLGLRGRKPGEPGVYNYQSFGFRTWEFWSEFVIGTGVICNAIDPPFCVTSNSIHLTGQVLATYRLGAPERPRLADRMDFIEVLDQSLPDVTANIVLWVDPEYAGSTLRQLAEVRANDEVRGGFDWVALREREEARLLPDLVPGKARGDLDPSEEERLAQAVDVVLRQMGEEEQARRLPEMIARSDRQISYLEAIGSLLATINLDPRAIDLSLRASVPLSDGE